MNEKQLDELLKRKKSATVNFPKNEAEFAGDFFAKIEKRRMIRFRFLSYAAGLLIILGLAVFFAKSEISIQPDDTFVKVSETVRLFGGDAAVLFFGNELVTGERESAEVQSNLVDVKFQTGARKIDLELACSDSDSIYLDSNGVSGNVVVSRCDPSTLVIDIDLKINGRRIRTVIPVKRRSGNRYMSDSIS